jgi:ATP-dependent DNA ligase
MDKALGPLPAELRPMEARLVEALPEGEGWQFEPKWDGFRCLAFRHGDAVALMAKSGKPLARYFPEVEAMIRALPADPFVIDGELVIPTDHGPSFDALQLRLHPAESRIRKLAAATPATLVLFDCLMTPDAPDLAAAPLSERRAALEAFFARVRRDGLRLSPFTRDRATAQGWLDQAGGALDGVIAKRLDEAYAPGVRAMLKVKRMRTADCVVGGFRYEQGTREVGSLLLGLYDAAGLLNHVGFTSTLPRQERPALTRRLEALAEPPGFTGDAPGGPSRWSTDKSAEWTPLRPELVVEVRYDHVSGGRFRHGTRLVRWRPDKAPEQCTCEQIAPTATLEALGF